MHHFSSRYWRILVTLFVLGVHLPVIAQQAYTLSGRVQHIVQEQRQPLDQASVEIINTGAAQATNSQGKFEFMGLSAGSLQLRIRYLGKVSIDTTFLLNGPTQLEFTLQDNSYRMEEVQVTALQSDRSAGTSSLIGRQAIEHLQANSLADIMSVPSGQQLPSEF